MKKFFIGFLILATTIACYQPERDCKAFKNGNFTFTSTINGEEKTTTFSRNGAVEIAHFDKKTDTASIRWINDCEYIVKNTNPKTKSEEQSIHIKILSTTNNSYTFEYGIVGDSNKSRGTAIKTN